MTFLRISNDFPMPDLEDQLVWSASLGLDLADRPVLEAEVLIWRIVHREDSTTSNDPVELPVLPYPQHVVNVLHYMHTYSPTSPARPPRPDLVCVEVDFYYTIFGCESRVGDG